MNAPEILIVENKFDSKSKLFSKTRRNHQFFCEGISFIITSIIKKNSDKRLSARREYVSWIDGMLCVTVFVVILSIKCFVSFCRRILLKPMAHNSEPLYDNWYTVQYFSYIHFDFTVSARCTCVFEWINEYLTGTRWVHIWCLYRTMLFEQNWLCCVYVYLTVRVGSRKKIIMVVWSVYATNKIDYINKTPLSLKTYSTNTISASPWKYSVKVSSEFRISTSFDSFSCFSYK